MKKLQTSLIALALLAMASASYAAGDCDATAGNIVANCGFESGDFTGWTLTGLDVSAGQQGNAFDVEMGADPFNGILPNSGSYQAYFGDLVSNATTLTQTLSTAPSTTYLVSFYLAQDATPVTDAGYGNQVVATFAGQTLTLNQVAVQGYTLESFMATASGTSSDLTITLGNGVGYFMLDDVSVVATASSPVPEPAPWELAGVGLLVAFAGGIRRLNRQGKGS